MQLQNVRLKQAPDISASSFARGPNIKTDFQRPILLITTVYNNDKPICLSLLRLSCDAKRKNMKNNVTKKLFIQNQSSDA